MYKLLVFVRVFALRTFVGGESWSRIWLAALDDKPAGGCANLFHRLLIPPSLNPSNSFFSPQSSSLLCQSGLPGSTMAIPTQGGAVEGCQTLPMHPTTHTHTHRPVVTSQIPSEGSARLASSLLSPLHLRCSLLLRPPCGETQVEPDSCSSATLQSTHASWVPSCPRGEPVGMEV